MIVPFLSRRREKRITSYKAISSVRVDIHTHILPGIDDGAPTLASSIKIARSMVEAGFSKVIATPHVMRNYYENTFETIRQAKSELVRELEKQRIPLKVETAAEYFLDTNLVDYVKSDLPLLTMGVSGQRPYMLVETGIKNEPAELERLIQELNRRHTRLILAHPENYIYLQNNFDRAIELFRMGVYFQVNCSSFHSHAESEVMRFVRRLVDYRMVSFVGSNLHHETQVPVLIESAKQPYFQLLTEIGLMNNDFK